MGKKSKVVEIDVFRQGRKYRPANSFRLGRLVLEQEALTYGALITATAKDTRGLLTRFLGRLRKPGNEECKSSRPIRF